MEQTEPHHHHGGIYNYFQGATIHNIVINGNMTKNGNEHYQEPQDTKKSASAEKVGQVLRACSDFIWGNAAYTVAFCACRDLYGWQDNASWFERQMSLQGIALTEGTINATLSRNPYMKLHVDKWKENGAMERVLKLKDTFCKQMDGEEETKS